MAVARLRYSASVDERETVGCFLELHVTRFFPRKMQTPLVERRSSISVAQSESENPVMSRDLTSENPVMSRECDRWSVRPK